MACLRPAHRGLGVIGLATVLLLAAPATAHEVPPRAVALVFVRPEAGTLRMLVRVPLESMRDIEWPLRGPGYLELDAVEPFLREAARLWVADYLTPYEDGVRLADERIAAIRVSAPADLSFRSWEEARAHVQGQPLPADTDLFWQQALIDVLFEVPIASDRSRFSIEPALAHLGVRTETILRFRAPDGPERVFRYEGDPGVIRLDPRLHQAFFSFLSLGFEHILGGLDHLLFVLCLVIPLRRVRPLIAVVTAFTVAHSITLIAAALGFAPTALWFPPLIETLIALSIVWLAFENIVYAARSRSSERELNEPAPGRNESSPGANEPTPGMSASRPLRHRWQIAFGFGLLHGFGFAFLLRDSLQFAGAHLAGSLLAFNIGVELGQVFVLAVAVPVLALLYRAGRERVVAILLSALVAHTAWHWMGERFGDLRQYEIRRPVLDLSFAVGALRALLLALIAGAAVWLLSGWFRRLSSEGAAERA